MTDATALLEAYLAAAGDGAAGLRLHALLAPEAPIYRAGRWQRAESESATSFAATHRELQQAGAGALPRFERPLVLSESGGVLWFAATEAGSSERVIGALGVCADGREDGRGDGRPRVGWSTLAEREAVNWSYEAGRAHTLANLSWMALREPALASTTLDAAWFRLHWLPRAPLTALPGVRFACRSSSACCRQEYVVAAPAGAQSLVDALPWERIAPRLQGTRLEPFGDDQVQIKSQGEPCRFLGARNECLIHAHLGYQPFAPCATFPFYFAATPEGVAVTASMTCDSVCESVGPALAEREIDLRRRLAIARLRTTDRYRLAPDRAVTWAVFRDTERLLGALLEREDLALHQRLYLGVRVLEARVQGAGDQLEAWANSSPGKIGADLRRQLADLLERVLRWDRRALHDLPKSVPQDLRHEELQGASRLAAELRNLHFSKVYSYEFDLTTAHNLGIVLYLIALAWQRQFPQGLDALRTRELSLLGSHGLLKSLLLPNAPPAFRALLGSAQFGEWALAFGCP
jgi:hypothetical protein